MQFAGQALGTVHAQQGGEGGLVQRLVRPLSFAQYLGIALNIENVVLHLKSQADGASVVIELLALCRTGTTG